MNKTFLISIILLFLFNLINAQVVNVEKRREADSTKNLIGKTELSLDINKSTSTIFTAKNSTQIQYHFLKSTYIFLADLQMMQIDTIRYLNNGFLHFRYNYDFSNKWLIAEAYTQVQFNRIQKIQRRFLWGAGGRFVLLNKEKYKIYSGIAGMYEFELYIDDTFQDKVRLSNYLSFVLQPIPEITIRNTTYYQPQINIFKNYRITNESSIEATIFKNLKYKTQFNYFFDSKPAPSVQKVFYSLTNGFIYRF